MAKVDKRPLGILKIPNERYYLAFPANAEGKKFFVDGQRQKKYFWWTYLKHNYLEELHSSDVILVALMLVFGNSIFFLNLTKVAEL